MTNKQLSPAAQAVLDATDYPEDWATRIRVSAALRAAADQVVPQTPSPRYPDDYESGVWEANQWARIELFTIANELEGK